MGLSEKWHLEDERDAGSRGSSIEYFTSQLIKAFFLMQQMFTCFLFFLRIFFHLKKDENESVKGLNAVCI